MQPTAASPTDGAVGLVLPAGKDVRVRLLALAALAAAVLTGCSGDSSSPSALAGTSGPTTAASGDTGSHTPTDLQHPCDLVSGRTASKLLGTPVTTRVVESKLAARTLDCSYAPAQRHADGGPSLEIRSTPDPGSLDAMIRLYLGVDRLPHHPVDIPGADDAEVVLDPEEDLVTVFFKQGFVTHAVVLRVGDLERAERIGLRLAELVLAGNQPG